VKLAAGKRFLVGNHVIVGRDRAEAKRGVGEAQRAMRVNPLTVLRQP
jgi:hypothetical protein